MIEAVNTNLIWDTFLKIASELGKINNYSLGLWINNFHNL